MPSASSMPSLRQRVTQGGPRGAPALHVQRGHAAPAPRPRATGAVVGVGQLQVEVARAVIGEMVDLTADPELAGAREGPGQGVLDLLVETPDREDIGMGVPMELRVVPRPAAGLLRSGSDRGPPDRARRSAAATRAARRSETVAAAGCSSGNGRLLVEALGRVDPARPQGGPRGRRAGWRRRTSRSTLPRCCARPGPGARLGGDGESARWPRCGVDRIEEGRDSAEQGAG